MRKLLHAKSFKLDYRGIIKELKKNYLNTVNF